MRSGVAFQRSGTRLCRQRWPRLTCDSAGVIRGLVHLLTATDVDCLSGNEAGLIGG